jgi:hypothetical protein
MSGPTGTQKVFDITDFGAIANTTGTISANSNQLTVNPNGWKDGSWISVAGAGAGGGPLVTTVQGTPVGNLTLTLALAASVGVTKAVERRQFNGNQRRDSSRA